MIKPKLITWMVTLLNWVCVRKTSAEKWVIIKCMLDKELLLAVTLIFWVRMWIQKSLSMIGHTQSLRMSIYCNCLLSPGGAITANWSVGYFCLCCFWFFSRPRRKAKLWKQGAEVKSTDQWNLFIAATVFFFFFLNLWFFFSHTDVISLYFIDVFSSLYAVGHLKDCIQTHLHTQICTQRITNKAL